MQFHPPLLRLYCAQQTSTGSKQSFSSRSTAAYAGSEICVCDLLLHAGNAPAGHEIPPDTAAMGGALDIGKGRAAGAIAHTQMPQFAFTGCQPAGDFAQARA